MTKEQRDAVARLRSLSYDLPSVVMRDLAILLDLLAEAEDERVVVVRVPRPDDTKPSQCTISKSCSYTHLIDINCGFFKAQRLGCTPGPGCPWYEEEK